MANINIDLDRKIGSVDRRIFGNFIEHLGRCIYGGVLDEGSPLSDDRGFRRDVLEAVRPGRYLYTGHSDYYVNVFQPHQAERAIRICERTIERVRYTQRIPHPVYHAAPFWSRVIRDGVAARAAATGAAVRA